MIKLFHSLVGRMWSRSLHLFFRARRGLTLGVRAVVTNENGKVLLVRHTYVPGWHFPGGGVEPGQTVKTALAEELRQETNLQLSGDPKFHGIFLNRAVSKRDHILVYICDTDGQLPTVSSSLEIAEICFFGVKELPAEIDPGTRRRIEEVFGGQESKCDW